MFHYPSGIIMMALCYYLAYKLSYRENRINIHFYDSTLNPWVSKYAAELEANFRKIKRKVAIDKRGSNTVAATLF